MKKWKETGGVGGKAVVVVWGLLRQETDSVLLELLPFLWSQDCFEKNVFQKGPQGSLCFFYIFLLLDLVPNCHFFLHPPNPAQPCPFPGLRTGSLVQRTGPWVCAWSQVWIQVLSIAQAQLDKVFCPHLGPG